MNPAPIKIVSRFDFEYMNLDGCPYAISIREDNRSVRWGPVFVAKGVGSLLARRTGIGTSRGRYF